MSRFVVAANPKPGSSLPYLLCLPVQSGPPVLLAARERWPGPKDVFCLPLSTWPEGAEPLEEVPVEQCYRRGRAVHLVLQRRQRKRSIFVWIERDGEAKVFWRSGTSMRAGRPGLRLPPSQPQTGTLTVGVDVRERYPWRFAGQGIESERRELPVGDYGVFRAGRLVAAVERKTPADLRRAAVDGSLGLALTELARVPRACIVVEGRLKEVLDSDHVNKDWLIDCLARLDTYHPGVSWVFVDNRALAEAYAGRWLRSALAAVATAAGSPLQEAVAQAVDAPRQLGLGVYDRAARLQEALRIADGGAEWSQAAYAGHFGVSLATASKDLAELRNAGALTYSRQGRRGVYVRP